MKFQLFQPHHALADFVFGILVSNADMRHLPMGTICPFPPAPQQFMYFYLNDPIHTQKDNQDFIKKPGSIVVGPQTKRVNLHLGGQHAMVGIIFRPTGLYRLSGMPMKMLVDEDVDSYSFFGKEITTIYQQLQEAESWLEMKRIVELFLLKKLATVRATLPFDHAIAELVKAGGLLSIEKTASLGCLSLRQFERLCHERIGLAPKFFARLVRFSNAYRLKEAQQERSWTSIAHATGYFDQMHLVRDFKTFAGVNPTVIETELGDSPFRLQAAMSY